MNYRNAGFALLLAGSLALPACSINVRDDYADGKETSCSVSCPGKGRASVSCTESETPACSCAPTPTSTCVTPGESVGVSHRHSAVSSIGLGGATPL
jgi:hypothetical protein